MFKKCQERIQIMSIRNKKQNKKNYKDDKNMSLLF
jgi:hypothetical protein